MQMNQFRKTAIAVGVANFVWMSGALAQQAAPAKPAAAKAATEVGEGAVVVVTGQRAALQSAQKIKQDADEIVDSIVAEDIGKLPDRSVTEVLQRVPGVMIERNMSRGDPEHFSVEGSGVTVRGLTWVRSELNGRDSFSANGGRALNFEDVPPELMAGVDVYKNPSAEQIEGGISGLINLRTALPFDIKGQKFGATVDASFSKLRGGGAKPSGSLLYSNRWETGLGEFGILLDLASSESATRTDAFQVEPYYPRINTTFAPNSTVWVPKGAQWRTLEFDRKREGGYAALQWKLDKTLKSHLTFFQSRYRMHWDELAIFAANGTPYDLQVANGTYNENGALLTGTLSDPRNGGINFNDDVRSADRRSRTTDIAWNIQWRPSPNWTITSDLQRVKASTAGIDSTVATGLRLPKEQVDLRGDLPRLIFDQADLAYLANPNNYYWGSTMEALDSSKARETAWKGDAKYDFDHPVLRDLRFGVRLTERSALSYNSGYNWQGITQSFQVPAGKQAMLGDPRFSAETSLHSFNNFFGGDVSVPAVVFPNPSLANGYPASYAMLHGYRLVQNPSSAAWKPVAWGPSVPSSINDQEEKTKALYSQLRFGFDDLAYPVDGNVGLRYVKSESGAHGYTVYNRTNLTVPAGYTLTGVPLPDIPAFAAKRDYENSYDNWLPSLNLRMKASEKLQFRLAVGSAMSRPDFSQMQAYTTLSQSVSTTTDNAARQLRINTVTRSGDARGNPMLRPITSKQVDLTAEWYFEKGSSLTLAVFNKRLKDIIVSEMSNYQLPDASGQMQDFTITSNVNGARGKVGGFELAYQQFYDRVPAWLKGIGLQANYTQVHSKRTLYKPVYSAYCAGGDNRANLNLNTNGCDTDGRTFSDMPLSFLSKHGANLALLYENGPWSARLAYSWRSKYLMSTNANGTKGGDATNTNTASPTFGQRNVAYGLPTWMDDYGQVDGGINYKITPNVRIDFLAQNLTDAKVRQLMTQHIGDMGRAWFTTGPRYNVRLGVSF
jgi:iron complex outermembrane receptor protein